MSMGVDSHANGTLNLALQLLAPRQPAVALGFHGALAAAVLASSQKSLTRAGVVHAALLGIALYTSFGAQGWLLGVIFLVVGSRLTKLRYAQKLAEGIAQSRGGARGPENVWGAGGAAALCAALHLFPALPPAQPALELAFVCAVCSKLSDTCGSEIGKAYGRSTYLITTLSPVPRGTEGAVSLEGTFAGIMGSAALAAIAAGLGVIPFEQLPFAIFAAFLATTAESVIGAALQNEMRLSNEAVNFLMTLIGAVLGIGGWYALYAV